MSRPPRAAFSLLEMMLATAVLLGCVIVLAELAGIGNQHVDDIEGYSTAQVICQATLGEMLCGAAAVESFESRPVDGHPGWMVSAEITPVDQDRVASLRVTVWYEDPAEMLVAVDPRRRHQFSLVRWTRDPYSPLPGGSDGSRPFSLLDEVGGGILP